MDGVMKLVTLLGGFIIIILPALVLIIIYFKYQSRKDQRASEALKGLQYSNEKDEKRHAEFRDASSQMTPHTEAYERYTERKKRQTPNIDQNEGMKHGVFTQIAYFVSWLAAIGGTLVGSIVLLREDVFIGATIIALSWVSASGIGTLAEISRKLTRENSKS